MECNICGVDLTDKMMMGTAAGPICGLCVSAYQEKGTAVLREDFKDESLQQVVLGTEPLYAQVDMLLKHVSLMSTAKVTGGDKPFDAALELLGILVRSAKWNEERETEAYERYVAMRDAPAQEASTAEELASTGGAMSHGSTICSVCGRVMPEGMHYRSFTGGGQVCEGCDAEPRVKQGEA